MLRLTIAVLSAAGFVSAATPAGTLIAAAGSPFTAGASPGAIVVGDFNRDGRPDIAVANRVASIGGVNILLGDGNGGFQPARAIVVGGTPWAIATGDFNGDKNLDLVVASRDANNINILLGDGNGGFARAGPTYTTDPAPSAVVTADFNQDGQLDIAVASLLGKITVLMGRGAGGFVPAINSPVDGNPGPIALAAGDINGDGRPDLFVANYFSSQSTDPNTGEVQFTPGSMITIMTANTLLGLLVQQQPISVVRTGLYPDGLAIGDFNGDGKPDVAVADFGSNGVTVLLSTGFGAFTPQSVPIPTGLAPAGVAAVDLNGDGLPDLAVINQNSNTAAILLGTPNGGFAAPALLFGVGAGPAAIASADFNGDGRMDLAIASLTGTVTVLLGAQAPTTVSLTSSVSGTVRAQLGVNGVIFGSATGSISLMDGSAVRATLTPVGGVANFDVSGLSGGVHNLTATYNGDARTAMSTSNALAITVGGSPVTLSGVSNGASFLTGAAAPNTILSLFGSNLGCAPVPEVDINHAAVEVLAATGSQINFVVPQQTGNLVLEVVCGGTRSSGINLQSVAASPALFTANQAGTGQASIVNRDGSINDAASAGARGDYLSVFGTGFGELAAADASGLRWLVHPVTAFVGEVPAEVQFSGAAPGYTVGLQQINVKIPVNAPTGSAVAIRLEVAGVSTQNGVTAAVR
jgi:uncharacterized protein (TIGR03437 family)